MAVDSMKDSASADAGACTCGNCPRGARHGHREAVATFVALRERLAVGRGVPSGLAHSSGASRQWVSDELTESARTVAERGRVEGDLRQRRLAGVLAAPLLGEDNRFSTSRAVAALWVVLAALAVLVTAVCRLVSDEGPAGGAGGLVRGAALASVVALTSLAAVVARQIVAVRVRSQRLQKLRGTRPRWADLLCDDTGRGSFADVQYVLVTLAVAVFAVVQLVQDPQRLPRLPWILAVLVAASALTYLAAKTTESGRPVVLSVVRVREAGGLDGPVRTGDDIEIRGCGFVPPGAHTPDLLGRVVVRIGAVHVHVPLVPVPGGFANPTDTLVTVPVPAEVEPGRVEVQVVTASGAVTNPFPVDIVD